MRINPINHKLIALTEINCVYSPKLETTIKFLTQKGNSWSISFIEILRNIFFKKDYFKGKFIKKYVTT